LSGVNIYYSNKNNLLAIVLQLLNKAINRIWIYAYIVNIYSILDILKLKAKIGVDIRVLLDLNDENKRVWLNKKNEIIRYHKVNVKFGDPSKYLTYHTKMMIIDNTVLFGSANFTDSGLRRNKEVLLVIDNPLLLSEFENIFLEDWKNGVEDVKRFIKKKEVSMLTSFKEIMKRYIRNKMG
jgi:phosphatidylserine/phosphatidylglycerophosphate/cardiolipin synthase-like enzyme